MTWGKGDGCLKLPLTNLYVGLQDKLDEQF